MDISLWKRSAAVGLLVLAGLTGCSSNNSSGDCAEHLQHNQMAAGLRAIRDSDAIVHTIQKALNIHEAGPSNGQLDLLRRAQQRARSVASYMNDAYKGACA